MTIRSSIAQVKKMIEHHELERTKENAVQHNQGLVAGHSVNQEKYLEIFNVLKETIKEARSMENEALKRFGIDLEKMMSDSSSMAASEKQKLEAAFSIVKKQKHDLEMENKRLVIKVNSLVDITKKSSNENSLLKKSLQATKSSHGQCQRSLEFTRHREGEMFSTIVMTKKSLHSLREMLFTRLLQAYNSYKSLYNLKSQESAKIGIKLKHYEGVLRHQKSKFQHFQQSLMGTLRKEESCWVLKQKFSQVLIGKTLLTNF